MTAPMPQTLTGAANARQYRGMSGGILSSSALHQWRQSMIAAGLSPRTIAERIRTVGRVEKHLGCPILSADSFQLADWIAHDDVSAATRAARHSILTSFFKWAAIVGLRTDNPMTAIKAARRPKNAPRPISDAAMARLLAESSDPQLTAMLILGGYQGLRVSEIARMRGDLIDPDSRTIRVRGKGGHVIVLPVHPRVLAIARRMPRGYWFPSQRGQHLGGRTISQRLRLHMIRCRVGGTAHSLRHRFCTSMVERGVDIRVVQELARHAQLSTTALYVAATDARQRAALEILA